MTGILVWGAGAGLAASTAAGQHKGAPDVSIKGLMDLEHMDKRKPVPLSPKMANHQKQNMREHLEAVQAIVSGPGRDDFSTVEKAAKKIGYSEEMKQFRRV